MASFAPLVFSTSSGMSGATNVLYKWLAYRLSLKKQVNYSDVMSWLHCCLSFSLLHNFLKGIQKKKGKDNRKHHGTADESSLEQQFHCCMKIWSHSPGDGSYDRRA